MASITCDRCGTVNLPNATYCASCGRALQIVNVGAGANEGVRMDMNMGAGVVSSTATGRLQPDSLLKQRYRILNTIGKGGMGAVYVAEDTRLGNRVVAIKEMSQSALSPQKIGEATENFKKEAHILAGLQHSQLPGIYDYFTDAGRWYLVMSFIQGETLENYLTKVPGRKLSVQQVLEIGIQLCIVLDYLHTQNPPVIFRDLKPANIMLTPDGRLCLIDFGIARHFKPGQALDTAAYGSVGYSAPEQYGQAQTTPRSDIYSLGVVLHQLITGRHPSMTPFDFPSLHSTGQPVPPALETLILHMLDMKESKRPADMASVQRALQQIASDMAAGTASAGTLAPSVPSAPYAPTILVRQPGPAPVPPVAVSPQQSQQSQHRPVLAPTVPFQPAPASKPIGWRLGRRQLVAMLLGTLMCGLLQYFSYQSGFHSWFQFAFNGTSIFIDGRLILTSAILGIVFFLAALYGPWVGLVVGGVGSVAADLLSGSGLGLGYLDIGLALAGFVVGLICLRVASRQNLTHNFGFVDAIAALGNLIYAVFGALGLLVVEHMTVGDTLILTLVYNAMYLVLTLLILTILLTLYNATARWRATA